MIPDTWNNEQRAFFFVIPGTAAVVPIPNPYRIR